MARKISAEEFERESLEYSLEAWREVAHILQNKLDNFQKKSSQVPARNGMGHIPSSSSSSSTSSLRPSRLNIVKGGLLGACVGILVTYLYFYLFVTNDYLILAIRKGVVSDVKRLLEAGDDPDQKDGQGRPALHFICTEETLARDFLFQNKVDILQLLVSSHVDFESRNRNGETALHVCAKYFDVRMLKELMKAGASINALTESKESVINILLTRGEEFNNEFVWMLEEIFITAAPSKSTINNKSPLIMLYNLSDFSPATINLADLLLRYGADPNSNVRQKSLLADILVNICVYDLKSYKKWLELVVDWHAVQALGEGRRIPLDFNKDRAILTTVCDVDTLKKFETLNANLHSFNYALTLMDEHMESFYRTQVNLITLPNDLDSKTKLQERLKILDYLLEKKVYMTNSQILLTGPVDDRTYCNKWKAEVTKILLKYAHQQLFLPILKPLSYGEPISTYSNHERTETILFLPSVTIANPTSVFIISLTCHGPFQYYWGSKLPPTQTKGPFPSGHTTITLELREHVTSLYLLVLLGENKRCVVRVLAEDHPKEVT